MNCSILLCFCSLFFIGQSAGNGNAEPVESLIRALTKGDTATRAKAARQLGKLGPKAEPAIPSLIKGLEDAEEEVYLGCADALVNIGAVAVPTLTEALSHKDNEVRQLAANILELIGPEAKPAVKQLIKTLKDSDSQVRKNAIIALREIGDERAIRPLIKAYYKDPEQAVAQAAFDALAHFGPGGKAAVPTLLKVLQRGDFYLKRKASGALARIGAPAVPALVDILKGRNGNMKEYRDYAAWILGLIGKDARAAVPALINALGDDNRLFRE